MPAITGVKETCLYVEDLERAKRFYSDLLGVRVLVEDARFCALDMAGSGVLLIFVRGGTLAPVQLEGGVIPPHDGAGPVHIGIGIEPADFAEWERRLSEKGIPVESRVRWPRGGESLYFRDPDGHCVELLTRGTWAIY